MQRQRTSLSWTCTATDPIVYFNEIISAAIKQALGKSTGSLMVSRLATLQSLRSQMLNDTELRNGYLRSRYRADSSLVTLECGLVGAGTQEGVAPFNQLLKIERALPTSEPKHECPTKQDVIRTRGRALQQRRARGF